MHGRYGAIAADRNSRLAGAGAVIFVHALLIALVWSALPKPPAIPRSLRETIILLTPKSEKVKAPPRAARHRASPPAARSPHAAPAPAIATAPQQLVIPIPRCAPENIGNLAAEEQAKCGNFGLSPPDRNTVAALRSHVKDPALHEAELAARKAPARVDCTRTVTRVISNIARDNGVMIDTLCAFGRIRRALGR